MGGRFRRLRLAAGAAALAGSVATVGVIAAAGTATAATLTKVSWAVSDNQIGATGVVYTYTFTTHTAGVLKSVTMSVPATTGGTPTVTRNAGLGAGSVALASTTLTYTVTSAVTVPAGTSIQLAFGGLTNTATAGSYHSKITTKLTGGSSVDTATSPTVAFSTTDTVVTVNVAESTSVSVDTQAFTFNMDPSLASLSTAQKTVNLTVKSNAGKGFDISVKDAGLKTGTTPTHSIAPATATGITGGAVAWPGASHFGFNAAITGTGGSPTLAGSLGAATKYVGYTTGGQTILTTSGPTGTTGVKLALGNRVQIDYSTAAGHYHDTLTYTVTPSY